MSSPLLITATFGVPFTRTHDTDPLKKVIEDTSSLIFNTNDAHLVKDLGEALDHVDGIVYTVHAPSNYEAINDQLNLLTLRVAQMLEEVYRDQNIAVKVVFDLPESHISALETLGQLPSGNRLEFWPFVLSSQLGEEIRHEEHHQELRLARLLGRKIGHVTTKQ